MRRFRARFYFALTAAVLTASTASAADIQNAARQMIRSHDLRDTHVAMFAMDLDTDQVLAAMHADDQMIPASNMKLITTAAALDILSPDFVFRTRLGLIASGIATETDEGDAGGGESLPSLLVTGDGDPAFGDPILLNQHNLQVDQLLDSWCQVIDATGHKHFAQLIVDDRIFDQQFNHLDWPDSDLIHAYGAQVAGLNFYQNCIDILPVPTRVGQAPTIDIFPPAPFFQTTNRAETGGSDDFRLDRRLGTNQLIFAGTVKNRRHRPFQVTIHDPPMVFGQMLAHRLEQIGIRVDAVARPGYGQQLPQAKPLHIVQTTLPLVINRTNQDSQNMFAEALFKRIGRQMTGQPGSWDNGGAAVRTVLRQRLGSGSASITVADGSGMSRDNRVTARLLVELLDSMHEDPQVATLYRKSLSRGGVNGTLQRRFQNLTGEVYAKSGYLSGVSSLSGYLVLPAADDAQRGRVIGFSIIMNGFRPPLYNRNMKNLQDKLVHLIDQNLTSPVHLGG